MVSPSRQPLVDRLNRYDRLLEIGIGDRRGVARALADRGCDVVAVDVAVDGAIEYGPTDADGSVLIRRGDVVGLASLGDPLSALDSPPTSPGNPRPTGPADPEAVEAASVEADEPEATETSDSVTLESGAFDAVYGINLPGELQRPAVSLAAALDADCLFTTLGFEEPVVSVERESVRGTTVYVAPAGSD